jgi:flagellar motor switch protein FliM
MQHLPSHTSILARKINRAPSALAPLASVGQLGREFAARLESRLRPALNTRVTASIAQAGVTRLDQVTGSLQSRSLLGLVNVRGAELPALIAAHPDLVSHLVEISLGGDPDDAAEPLQRVPTAVDAVLCRAHLDAILDALAAALAASLDISAGAMFHITGQRQNISQLPLPYGSTDVLVLEASLNIGPGGRSGAFQIALPLEAIAALKRQVPREGDQPDDPWKTMMRKAVAGAPVHLNAVLHRQKLSLAELRDLQAGHVLEIPVQVPENVELTLAQPDGRGFVVAPARLGAFEGAKVLKLTTLPARKLTEHIERLLQKVPAPSDPPAIHEEDPPAAPEAPEPAPQGAL